MGRLLALALAVAALVGCSGDDKSGVKVQPGDYSGPPGNARGPKGG